MYITLMCPNLTCRAILRVPASVRGKRGRCCKCRTEFLIPCEPAAAASTLPTARRADATPAQA